MERKTETAKHTYICASLDCVWGHRKIQRGESHAVIVDGMFQKRFHHPCADQDFPDLDHSDEYEDMAESWREHVDKVNYINGR